MLIPGPSCIVSNRGSKHNNRNGGSNSINNSYSSRARYMYCFGLVNRGGVRRYIISCFSNNRVVDCNICFEVVLDDRDI